MTEELGFAVLAAMEAQPTQRLGQIIFDLTRGVDLSDVYDEELEARLWLFANGE